MVSYDPAWSLHLLGSTKEMRALSRVELEQTLARGKGVAQICGEITYAGRPALRYVVLYKKGLIEVWLSEVFDIGHANFGDVTSFTPTDPGEDPVVHRFSTIDEALAFAEKVYSASRDSYVNESMLDQAYLEYRKFVASARPSDDDPVPDCIGAEWDMVRLLIRNAHAAASVARVVRKCVDIPISELVSAVRAGSIIGIGHVQKMQKWESEPWIFGLISEIQSLNAGHQWYLNDVPLESHELAERVRRILNPKDECHGGLD